MSVEAGSEKKKRVKVPHTYVILISVVVLATVMTYICLLYTSRCV